MTNDNHKKNLEMQDMCPFSKSTFQMLKDFAEEFTPRHQGVLMQDEVHQIEKCLQIRNRNLMSLQNLRDFTVMYFDILAENSDDKLRLLDIMSGIVGVIDTAKLQLGGSV